MLTDQFNRVHNYLRISLTDKCNLRCAYCNPVDLPRGYFKGSARMTAGEIEQIVAVFVTQGVKKIRLTGGEPLVRKDAGEIIQRISKYPVELAISTNAVLVDKYIDVFKDAGIQSVNVSLDSLTREKFFAITRRDEFNRILDNIYLLLQNKFHVKINVVVMKNVNDDELNDFIAWTKHLPVHIRFIEFMPFAGNDWSREKVFSYQEMLAVIATQYKFLKLQDAKHDTDKKYLVPGYEGTFAVISTMSQPFCSGCNRMRLTTDGKMKNCLFSKTEVDILGALRSGVDIAPLIQQCVWDKEKALGGQFTPYDENFDASSISNRRMINIGG
ncbi:MAG: cyclic pyranopterin phosphate synthase MoaA [Niastella sp. SCN 39-18]|nr:GTP 3',8-cyclase MoaA [Sphingobacteriales bacterium]ODT51892.1 MAG: cyclic pyranopterin phosphate synthase MoaA [Niastella sp. SCN 39-18]OJW11563.1 MAG: cyclic pyranopterin phosphate synthase MoaA [Sphingobacteriales bacterium 39-19]